MVCLHGVQICGGTSAKKIMLRMTTIFKKRAWEFAAAHLLRERRSGVRKQLQSNNRVSGATFPDMYVHVADDSY